MRQIFRKNQVLITILAVLIGVAGFITISGNNLSQVSKSADGTTYESQDIASNGIITENTKEVSEHGTDVNAAENTGANQEVVEYNVADQEVAASNEDIASLDLDSDQVSDPGQAVLTNGLTVNDYIAQVKMNREQVRGRNKDALLSVINNESLTMEERQVAVDNMTTQAKLCEMENATETLLNARGFTNTVVSVLNGKVDVVICQDSITEPEKAQIEDIVKRKTEIGIENISIALMETAKETQK